MAFAIYPALFFTVAMLVTTAYFLLGGLPLLVLQHDTPLDARFIRSFFGVYYKAAIVTTVGATLSYALWAKLPFALGTAALLVLTLLLRRRLLAAMQRLGGEIEARDAAAVQRFRRLHITALAVNLVQLLVLVWGTTRLSL